MDIPRRIIGAFLLSIALTLLIVYIFILIISFPLNHPEKTLAIGEKVTAFIARVTLPIKLAQLSWQEPDKEILMPVYGVRVSQIGDSWMSPRPDGRSHEGQDVFADRGTPVFSGTKGFITRIGEGDLGGNFVYVTGAGGRRYYYAHFDRIPEGLYRGQWVTPDTVIGFVGNTGNAETTPYHLHFGVYANRKAIDPLPLLTNRP